jgi:outer membrane lipoprotein SlyB
MIGARIGPVAQATIGIGLTQLATWVLGAFGGGAIDRRPEEDGAILGLEVVVLIATSQNSGFDGGRGDADRDAEVPHGEFDHVQSS